MLPGGGWGGPDPNPVPAFTGYGLGRPSYRSSPRCDSDVRIQNLPEQTSIEELPMQYRQTRRITAMVAIIAALVTMTSMSALAASMGQFCGGILDIRCDQGLFCDLEGGACGAGDRGGTCARIPRACTRGVQRPVCGCNGKTYGNNCERRLARMSRWHAGAC
jgi:hypothetical protein